VRVMNRAYLKGNSTELRKNMTPEESKLWYQFLKKLPVTVNRQKRIGNYIADFYIASAHLVIELDGMQHLSPEHLESDRVRDAELNDLRITVIRYGNADIREHFDAVCRDISRYMTVSVN